jgi:hypothetical protein
MCFIAAVSHAMGTGRAGCRYTADLAGELPNIALLYSRALRRMTLRRGLAMHKRSGIQIFLVRTSQGSLRIACQNAIGYWRGLRTCHTQKQQQLQGEFQWR